MSAQVVEESTAQGEDTSRTHLDDKAWLKNRIRFNVQELQELEYQKTQEDELTTKRRQWFNNQIDRLQDKLQDLKESLEEVRDQ
jgi:hypothetical protein